MQLCPDNVPFEVLDADFFARLLVVIEPFPLCQLYAFELGIRLNPVRQPLSLTSVSTISVFTWRSPATNLRKELGELETPAIELDNLLGLCGFGLLVRGWGGLDGGRRLPLPKTHNYGQMALKRLTGVRYTLQFLHFHTKLASPRLPLISLFS
jgi:hypothetical protein